MSEDEAIKILKEIIPDDLLNCWEGGEKEFEAIETILDLYEQEKERNRLLIKNIAEIRDKLECLDWYGINNAVDDLTKLIGDGKDE